MKLKVKNVRLAFPSLFRKTAFEDEEPKYSAVFILPKDHPQVGEIKSAVTEIAKDQLKEDYKRAKPLLRDGAEKVHVGGFGDDVYFFSARNSARPKVVDTDRSPLVEEDGKPYGGCYVDAVVTLWVQNNKFGKRVNAELNGVQFRAAGQRFGGGGVVADDDDFEVLEEATGASDDDPDWI